MSNEILIALFSLLGTLVGSGGGKHLKWSRIRFWDTPDPI